MPPNESLEARLAREAHERVVDYGERTRAAAARAAERAQKADDAGSRQEQRDADASARLQAIRYPNGLRELRAGAKGLEVGDVLKRDGETWRVVSVDVGTEGRVVVTLGSEAA